MEAEKLQDLIKENLSEFNLKMTVANGELTVEIIPEKLIELCTALRDKDVFKFEQLIDLCGVDYSEYGVCEWETNVSSFSRGVEKTVEKEKRKRFAVVYHLLSLTHNSRIRVRTFAEGDTPMLDTVTDIWSVADWFEREAFDLFGIVFKGHHDLRRILTDYGFIGHPLRKDFPLIGETEIRYDEKAEKIIHDSVGIEPRTLVPKVIRRANKDNNN